MAKVEQATSRSDMYLVPPEKLTLVVDKAHPLFDERVSLPVDENLVKNIMVYGVKEPVLVRRDGDDLLVIAGRQRTKAAIEANKRLRKEGSEPLSIRVLLERADDATMLGIMVLENEARVSDNAITRADKLTRFLALGKSEEEAAIAFCKPVSHIKALLKLADCSPKVRNAVKAERLSLSAAAKLAGLSREEQDEKLDGLLEDVPEGKRATVKKTNKATGKGGTGASRPGVKEIEEVIGFFDKGFGDALDKTPSARLAIEVLTWAAKGGDPEWLQKLRGAVEEAATEDAEDEAA